MTHRNKPHHIIYFALGCMLLISVLTYFLTLQKTASFSTEINTTLPPDILWEYLELSFEEPGLTPIWPKDIMHITPVTLREGGAFKVTYDMTIARTTVDYIITHYEYGKMISYSTTDDRKINGTTVLEVIPRDGGSTLRRSGYYSYRGFSMLATAMTSFFENKVAPRIERNLREAELYEQ